ncbi:MAG: methyltransferase domain-containing protein [Acidimicrobiia bacterium]|nr:methyltransferase domain-containing protein [Acidimicrobiia bacterium]
MITAAPASFYDADLATPDSLALIPLEQSPWLALYEEVLRWLPRGWPIVDLGCGTGRLARLLANHGWADYQGHDFSPMAIQTATA